MTNKQRWLIWGWGAGVTLIVSAIAFHWIALCLVPVAAFFRAKAGLDLEAEEEGRSRLAEFVDEYPFLKFWFGACALVFFAGAIYVIRSNLDLFGTFGPMSLVIAFAVLLAPMLVLLEFERFKSYGEPPRAP